MFGRLGPTELVIILTIICCPATLVCAAVLAIMGVVRRHSRSMGKSQ